MAKRGREYEAPLVHVVCERCKQPGYAGRDINPYYLADKTWQWLHRNCKASGKQA
jgi:hypothetical protein